MSMKHIPQEVYTKLCINYRNTSFTAKICRSNSHLFIKHILLKEKKTTTNKENNSRCCCQRLEAVQMYIASIHLLNQHHQRLRSICTCTHSQATVANKVHTNVKRQFKVKKKSQKRNDSTPNAYSLHVLTSTLLIRLFLSKELPISVV